MTGWIQRVIPINQQFGLPLHARAAPQFQRNIATDGAALRALKTAFVLLLVVSAVTTTRAQTNRLSLAEAKRLAFARNWDLLAAQSDVDAASAQKIIAREFPNPSLSWTTMKISVDNHPGSTPSGNGLWERSYDTIAAVNQLFEIGGKRSSRRASAAAGYEAARARLFDAKRILDLAVTKAYIAALQADLNVQILSQSAQSLRKEAQIAETRLNAGDISRMDKDQIEIAAERFELDARSAQATATSLRIALQTLLGNPRGEAEWTAADSLETLADAGAPVGEPGVAAPRPDLLAAEALLKKTEADLRLQKAMRVPDPTLQFNYEHEPPDQPNTVGLGLSFPLPLWNRNQGAIRLAEASRAQANAIVGKIRTQIGSEVESARVGYQDGSTRWKRYREQILPRSEEVRKTVAFAYEKGGASLLDLLSAERNDNDVRLATAQAAADTAAAAASLKAALNLQDENRTEK